MSVQFTIPRLVVRELDAAAVRQRARDAGVLMPSLEMNDKDAGPSSTRITCQEPIARALIEELRVMAAAAEPRQNWDLVKACAEGVRAALDAIEKGSGAGRDASPAKGIGRAMG